MYYIFITKSMQEHLQTNLNRYSEVVVLLYIRIYLYVLVSFCSCTFSMRSNHSDGALTLHVLAESEKHKNDKLSIGLPMSSPASGELRFVCVLAGAPRRAERADGRTRASTVS